MERKESFFMKRLSLRVGILLLLSTVVLILSLSGWHAHATALALKQATFTTDGVTVTVHSSALPDSPFQVRKSNDPLQMASTKSHNPYFSFDVIAVPYHSVAQADQAMKVYLADLNSSWDHQMSAPETSLSFNFFGKQVKGTLFHVKAPTYAGTTKPVTIGEWETAIGFRVWIIRVMQEVVGQQVAATKSLTAKLQGTSLTSSTLNQPSTSLLASSLPTDLGGQYLGTSVSSHSLSQVSSSFAPTNPTQPSDVSGTLGLPSWWNGQICDTGTYGGSYAQTSNGVAVQYHGVYNCGPRPGWDFGSNYVDVATVTFPGGRGEYEWECVELSKRWLNLAYSIPDNYAADGSGVVLNYPTSSDPNSPNSRLQRIVESWAQPYIGYSSVPGEGTSFTSSLNDLSIGTLSPGDVVSWRGPHTSVVTSVSIDGNGNGSFTTMDQNSLSTSYNHPVSGWHITQSYSGDLVGWLHDTKSGGSSSSVGKSVVSAVWNSGGNHLEIFAVGVDGNMWHDWPTSDGSWAHWASMQAGYHFQGAPAAIWNSSVNHLEVFGWGVDGNIWHDWPSSDGTWNNWAPLQNAGYRFASSPVVAYNVAGNYPEVFAIGVDGNMWHDWPSSDGTWANWTMTQSGYHFQGTPAVIWNAGVNHLEVFGWGVDGNIWHDWPSNGYWTNWTPLQNSGYRFASSPSVAYNVGGNYPEVFAIGVDGNIWHDWPSSGGSWANWAVTQSGYHFQGTPALVWNAAVNHLEVFGLGVDGNMWHDWPSNGYWTNWAPLQNANYRFNSSPGVVYNTVANYPEVFAVGVDTNMWHDWPTGGSWANWTMTQSGYGFW
jgi:hypothetical protein